MISKARSLSSTSGAPGAVLAARRFPGLIALYKRCHADGLELVGLSYEKEAGTEAEARETVKKFVREAGIPYVCLMGETDVLKQIPGWQGFPTTVIVDRAGRVRVLITENTKTTPRLHRRCRPRVACRAGERPDPDGQASTKKTGRRREKSTDPQQAGRRGQAGGTPSRTPRRKGQLPSPPAAAAKKP